jgi:Protein of unknown function (DUF2442)
MDTFARATAVRFDEHTFWVDRKDDRTLGVPLVWYPRLLHGTPALHEKVSISAVGLHWEVLDEDISMSGLIAGRADQTVTRKQAA